MRTKNILLLIGLGFTLALGYAALIGTKNAASQIDSHKSDMEEILQTK